MPSGHPEGIVPVVARVRPSGGFELAAWVAMRVSGVLLALLALGHVLVMHVITGVEGLSFDYVAVRWGGAFWRVYDGLLLVLAVLHGLNGVRTIAEDYVRQPARIKAVRIALAIVCAFLLVLGLAIIATFEPSALANQGLVR